MRHRILTVVFSFGLLAGLAAQPVFAQQGARWKARQQARRQAVQQQRKQGNGGAAKGQFNPRGMAGLPPKWVAKLRDMPPEEQQRFMQNNEQFQHLPPERQEQVRRNLERWNNLPPEQQTRIRATEEMLERATLEQREHFQNEIVPKLEQMPPERRQRVIGHWRRLQGMTPEEQQSALGDPGFMRGLSPDEQAIVRDLNSMGSPPSE
ncbi:MAG TPA: DUF3106 domain-containing protein [Candidatus Acidoferrales bacterium]|nr:DUF3106 domain-containing protein [Candidatus Acidoferrales bacterium]